MAAALWDEAEACDAGRHVVTPCPAPPSASCPRPRSARPVMPVGQGARGHASYQNQQLQLYSCDALKLLSKPGEREGDFRAASTCRARTARCAAAKRARNTRRRWCSATTAAACEGTRRARERPALAAEVPDRDHRRPHPPRRAARTQGHLHRQHRSRHHGGTLGIAHRPRGRTGGSRGGRHGADRAALADLNKECAAGRGTRHHARCAGRDAAAVPCAAQDRYRRGRYSCCGHPGARARWLPGLGRMKVSRLPFFTGWR